VTADNASKFYGATPVLSAFTTAGLVNGETVGSVTETSPGSVATAPVAGSPFAITPSAATGGTFTPSNYVIGYVNGLLTVIPLPLTVTANDVTKSYGETPVLSLFSTAGLVNGETVGSVTETSPGSVATAPVAGSPFAITPSAATGGTFTPSNYTIGYVNGLLTVLPVPVVVPPVVVPPVVVPPVVVPPVVVPPAEVPSVVVPPVETENPVIGHEITLPVEPVVVPTWMPIVELPKTPEPTLPPPPPDVQPKGPVAPTPLTPKAIPPPPPPAELTPIPVETTAEVKEEEEIIVPLNPITKPLPDPLPGPILKPQVEPQPKGYVPVLRPLKQDRN
jgi:hypothetical protein